MISPRPRHLFFFLCLVFCTFSQAATYEIKPEQKARLEKFIPRSFAKLSAQQPLHVVTIGDSVMTMFGYTPEYGNTLKAYPAVFAQELADQFFYPGGVKAIRPQGGHPEKAHAIFGQEITIENLARDNKLMLHAMQTLSSVAFVNKPDLVMVGFGIHDAIAGCDLATYRRSLEEVIETVRAQGSDIILLGPSLISTDPPEQGMALTRPYADTMREVADAKGVFFADLGDLTWLTQIDDREVPLLKPKKIDPEVLAHPSPVKSPLEDQQDPDPEKKAARLFNFIAQDYRKYFNHGNVTDWVHPDASLQRVLGKRIYQELLNGSKPVPWKVGYASATLEGGDKCKISYNLENLTNKELSVTLLPLVTAAWRPQDAPAVVTLKAKETTTIHAAYVKTPINANRIDSFMPTHEALLRIPIIHVSGSNIRIEDVRSIIKPLAVLWDTGTKFNVEGEVELQGRILNPTEQTIKGQWQATWQSQTWKGTFNIPAHGESPVKVKVKTPVDATTLRQKGGLKFNVTVDGKTMTFDREIEMVRNFGLKEKIILQPASLATQDTTPPKPASSSQIVFHADADAKALYLTWDIQGVNLQENPEGNIAFVTETSLDARSYGKRLLPGATELIRAASKASDGSGDVDALAPWIFGTGYAMSYNEKAVQTKLTTNSDGTKKFTMALPRSYLYLHEWSLGNGNSQLGLNTTFQLWQKAGADAKGAFVPFSLSPNAIFREDADSLAVLELTEKPTRRWTVRCY